MKYVNFLVITLPFSGSISLAVKIWLTDSVGIMICQGLVSMCKFNNSSEETWGETLSVLFIHKASAGQTKNPFTNIYTVPHEVLSYVIPCFGYSGGGQQKVEWKTMSTKNYYFHFWVIYYTMIMYWYTKHILF